ncbi:hypothetical protein KGY73_00800 [bacterium]|nr:hypothetical protein [bacterium]
MTEEKKPDKKGLGTGKKVAIGCGVVAVVGIIIIVVAVISGGLFLSKKAKEAGIDTELLRKNPALATAKMVVASNPELELVNVDEKSGTLTVNNKKTGETLTADFKDIQKGRITFKTEEGEKLTLRTEESGVKAEVKDEKGEAKSMEFGTSAEKSKIPDWIPIFEGELSISFTSSEEESRTGTFSIETDASPEDVRDFYLSRLEKLGFSMETNSSETETTHLINLFSSDEDNQRELVVNILQEEEGVTNITLQYQERN